MEELFNILKEAEDIKQNIKFTKICEAYNAADLKKTDLDGYTANTQSFRQYIKEIMELLAKLNQEMAKIYKIDTTMFSRNANINNFTELEKTKNAKISKDLTVKYTNIELKLFLCIRVFYTIIDIYRGFTTEEKSQVSEEILATKDHLIKVIAAVKEEFKIQQAKYGNICNYTDRVITVEQADKYFTLDNLKNHFQKGIDVLGGGSSNHIIH
jgi:hypothetical protein